MPLRLTITLALLAAASAAKAELIERDWLAPGDGLLTYNPATGREWLDVTQTFLQPYGDTIDGAVAIAKLDLEPGGRFEGFTLAGRAEVIELGEALGFIDSFPESGDTGDELRALLNLLDVRGEEILGEQLGGPILDGEPGGIYGVIDEVAPLVRPGQTVNMTAHVSVGAASTASPSGGGGVVFTNATGEEPRIQFQNFVHISALLLYRVAVPEPGTLLSIAVASLAVFGMQRRQTRS